VSKFVGKYAGKFTVTTITKEILYLICIISFAIGKPGDIDKNVPAKIGFKISGPWCV